MIVSPRDKCYNKNTVNQRVRRKGKVEFNIMSYWHCFGLRGVKSAVGSKKTIKSNVVNPFLCPSMYPFVLHGFKGSQSLTHMECFFKLELGHEALVGQ